MLTILSVAIGIILVLLLMSILASTMHDIVASAFSLRAKHLRKTLVNMLGEQSDSFFKHPFFRQLTYADHQNTKSSDYDLPDWINKETFSAILHDVLQKEGKGDTLAEKISNQDDPTLRKMLEFLVRESNGTIGGLKDQAENWFEEVMQRSSGFFARATKWRLFFIGFVLALLLNADTIHIYQALSSNTELREKMVGLAENMARLDSLPEVKRDTSVRQQIRISQEFLSEHLAGLESPLGLGWNEPVGDKDFFFWLIKLAGFLLTGIAVTFGAPFWFDLLKKMLALRNGNTTPVASPPVAPPAQNKKADMNTQPIDTIHADLPSKEDAVG